MSHIFSRSPAMTSSFVLLGAMDSFARGLKNAAKLIEDGTLDSLVKVSLSIVNRFVPSINMSGLRRLSFFLFRSVSRMNSLHIT